MNRKLLDLVITEERYLSVNVRTHPILPFRDDLNRAGFITSRELRRKKNGERVKVAGRLVLVHAPPTRSGIRVMFITLEDEYGLIDLVLFPLKQHFYAETVLSHMVCLSIGKVRKLGKHDVSVVIEEVKTIRDFYRLRGHTARRSRRSRRPPGPFQR